MTNAAEFPGNTPPPTLSEIASRLEELTREVRRQGRAAVAAQAAAESCLEKLSLQPENAHDSNMGDEAEDYDPTTNEGAEYGAKWVRSLLPMADALDRMVSQCAAMVELRPPPPKPASWFARLAGRSEGPSHSFRQAEFQMLSEGLRVLRAQLTTALESCGVTIDRRVLVPIDPEVHRVVETRASTKGDTDGIVVEVVRPGYRFSDLLIREADVVAAKSPGTTKVGS